jgi:ATP-binding cassette subfamily C (CFTR/MRP) protein 1
LGRITNRFSKDIYTVDAQLPENFQYFFYCAFRIVAACCVISIVTPWFLLAIPFLAAIYVFIRNYYVATARELRRLDSVSRSPIFAHFTETLQGVSTLRAFGRQHEFIIENRNRIDANTRGMLDSGKTTLSLLPCQSSDWGFVCLLPFPLKKKASYLIVAANRWLATRIEAIGAVLVLVAALAAIFSRDTLAASAAGLSLSYCLQVTELLNFMVRMSADLVRFFFLLFFC